MTPPLDGLEAAGKAAGVAVEMPAAEVWRGRVVRAWREASGLSLQALADELGVSRAAVSNWERGVRAVAHWETGLSPFTDGRDRAAAVGDPDGPVVRTADRLAAALGLHGSYAATFHGMLAAAGTVQLRPQLLWRKNFPVAAGPVWAWIRPAADAPSSSPSRVALRWGALAGHHTADLTDAGLLIALPTSVANPPLEVALGDAGWVDFGLGTVLPDLADRLGAQVVDGRTLIASDFGPDANDAPIPDSRQHHAFGLLRHLADVFGIQWRLIAPHARAALFPEPPTALDGTAIPVTATAGPTLSNPEQGLRTQLTVTLEELRAYRKARGLSRARAAALVTELNAQEPVTERSIETLESGGLPDIPQLLGRLDTVYRADGRLGLDVTYHSATRRPGVRRHVVHFPPYWVGPVWLRATGPRPDATGSVVLQWDDWRRRQRLASDHVVTTRRATHDAGGLVVDVPTGWTVVAGVGAQPQALDINHGWFPASFSSAVRLIMQAYQDVQSGRRQGRRPQPKRPLG